MTGGVWPDFDPFPNYPSEGWLLDEDRALRDLMKGVTVSDHAQDERHVEAWFGHPDQELREQKYPYITVDLLQIEEGKERVHRGDYFFNDPVWWWNYDPLPTPKHIYRSEMPTPIDLFYQVSTWARNPRHDRQMLFQLITGGRTRIRGNLLYTADRRIRRLDWLGHTKRDTIEDSKRLFNNVFRLRVSSQVPYGVIGKRRDYAIYGPVYAVYLDYYGYAAGRSGATALSGEHQSIVAGEVVSWDQMERTADVNILTATDPPALVENVSVVRDIPALAAGELVSVLRQPLTDPWGPPFEYRLLVISTEVKPEPSDSALVNGASA